MPEILHLVKMRAAPDQIYQALVAAEGLQNWWTRDATLEAKISGIGEIGFYDHGMVINLEITDLKQSTSVTWRVLSSTNPAFNGTIISFHLKVADDDVTTVLFKHAGFPDEVNSIASATTRWGFYLLSLNRYLETGRGSPNPEDIELIR